MTVSPTTSELAVGVASRLSPAPRTLGLSIASLVAAVVLTVCIAALGGMAAATGSGETTGTFGLVVSTLGVAMCGWVLWKAIRSLSHSNKARRLGGDDVLSARASAERARTDALISFGLGFIVVIGTCIALLLLLNDASVQKTFFRVDLMAQSLGGVVRAFGLNIFIACVAEVLILMFGMLLAVARILPGPAGKPIRTLAIAYIDGLRAVPAIIVLYMIGFGLPLAGVPFLSSLDPAWYAIIALTLTHSAYVAEVYRSGIESIHPSQTAASRSVGFSYGQTLRFVVLPQAVKAVIPPLLGMFIALQKDTALVNIIGAVDAFNQAKYFAATNFNLSSVTVVAMLFIVITIPQTRLVDWGLQRSAKRRKGGLS